MLRHLFLVAAAAAASPQQIHVAFAGETEGTGMTVSWATDGSSASMVKYGTSAGTLDQTATGTSTSYMTPLLHHHTTLTGLTPNTQYFYQCGNDQQGYSDTFSFTTAPGSSSAHSGAFTASVFGDWGYGENGNAIATRGALEKLKQEADFVWHLGDIGYADDAFLHNPAQFTYETVYNNWMNWIQNMTTTKAYMVAPGNHESECHSPDCLADAKLKVALSNFSAYIKRWKMPYEESGSPCNMWYSYNFGLAHFVSINTETDFSGAAEEHHGDSGVIPAGGFGAPGEYLAWLENDLKAADANRAQRPWVFAGGHRPLYTASGTESKSLAVAVEALFQKYHVDVYFAGHEHSYARSLPVYKSQAETTQDKNHYKSPKSTAHVLVGGAGCDEMHSSIDQACPTGTNASDCGHSLSNSFPPNPITEGVEAGAAPWNVFADKRYGTGTLTVYNATTMQWKYIHSADMQVADYFYITK